MKIFTKTFLLIAIAFFCLLFGGCKKEEDASVTVKTYHVTKIGPTSGTFRGTVAVSNTDIIDAGIVYSTSVTYPKIKTCPYVSAGSGSLTDFTVTLTGLNADSTYRFRAYASTADSTYYGTIYYFKPTNINISVVSVPGGTFTMGATSEQSAYALSNEEPSHSVTLSGFQIGKYEVTNAQYALFLNSRCVPSTGSCLTTDGTSRSVVLSTYKALYYNGDISAWSVLSGYENLPVVYVTWYGANEFCLWAGGRMPTEAEWEFAARGGASGTPSLYSGSNTAGDVAWYTVNVVDKNVQPIGGKAENQLHIYDMSGNAWEWVADWYNTYSAKAQTNPVGLSDDEADAASITQKVRRGGGWADNDAKTLRVSGRGVNEPSTRSGSVGFRFAKSAQ